SEIEAAGVNQYPLENIFVAAQMCAPHAAGVVEVRERAFDALAALPHQAPSAWPAHASTIAIDGRLRVWFFRPVASAAVRLGDVRPDADRLEVHHRLIAVIALVADDLFQRLRLVDIRLCVLDLLRRSGRGLADSGRVA